MWIYQQSSGNLYNPACEHLATGYSGHGSSKNRPADQDKHDLGPIPVGYWNIGVPHDSANTGPYSLPLTPAPGTETFGRSAFLCHGDSSAHPGEASHGCVIVNRWTREQIVKSGDFNLAVIA